MDITQVWEKLALDEGGTIVYLILDGLGGIQHPEKGVTELQASCKPNLDGLAKDSSCGLLEIVGAGITPGSGPGHLALFGYNPLDYEIGRGIFSALGINFDLKKGDVAARINFCTMDDKGIITDRRAGRIPTSLNERLCEKLRESVKIDGIDCFVHTESEHRAVLVLRGEGLEGGVADTDPGLIGHMPLDPAPLSPRSKKTSECLRVFLEEARAVLKEEKQANMILIRGVDKHHPVKCLRERFLLNGLCIAEYPMYKGVSRLLGMDVCDSIGGIEGLKKNLQNNFDHNHNFYFVHVKYPDKAGEDRDFERKVRAIEEVDAIIPDILKLEPDVLVITGDHSTPAAMGLHSWHSVPVLIHAKYARRDGLKSFDEMACLRGSLGQRPASDLIGLSMAHGGRLKKFGA